MHRLRTAALLVLVGCTAQAKEPTTETYEHALLFCNTMRKKCTLYAAGGTTDIPAEGDRILNHNMQALNSLGTAGWQCYQVDNNNETYHLKRRR